MQKARSEQGAATDGESRLRHALELAQRRGARSYELRAATSLARLSSSRGRPAEARELLASIVAWFGDGVDPLDLREARELLDALA